MKLGGDGRSDLPGHCAKYGSYTFMDVQTQKVVDVQLVQVILIDVIYIFLILILLNTERYVKIDICKSYHMKTTIKQPSF